MNTSPMNSSLEPNPAPVAVLHATQPIRWSIRREFWENRYLYIAPVGVASVFLLGYLISAIHSPAHMRALIEASGHGLHDEMIGPFDIAAGLMMGSAILMSLYYSSEALHSERRDRSILFWKSLPVSDFTAVAVKASVPLLILPALVSAITLLMQFLMLIVSTAAIAASGGSVAALWSHVPIFQMSLLMFYHVLTAHALWPAPVYCWLILVSGWARRATFLWAALPIIAIGGMEKLAFNTMHFATLIGERLIGSTAPTTSTDAFPTDPMTHITPLNFLASPGLWVGLGIAAVFLAIAIRRRRYSEPI